MPLSFNQSPLNAGLVTAKIDAAVRFLRRECVDEVQCRVFNRQHFPNPVVTRAAEKSRTNRIIGRGGGDQTRPPNYKAPWNDRGAVALQIQLLILLPDAQQSSIGRPE